MRICRCARWESNTTELEIMMRSQIVCKGGYKGEPFEYCPWCGKELIAVDPKEEIKKNEYASN